MTLAEFKETLAALISDAQVDIKDALQDEVTAAEGELLRGELRRDDDGVPA
jgi:hypothetical protein